MPSIGETLREARMRQRLDIADVEERTKIRAKYLRALENEEFGMLPGPTFVKSFIRTYAEPLGLDPHRWSRSTAPTTTRATRSTSAPSLGPPDARARPAAPGPRIGPGSLLLIALALVVAALVAIGLTSGDDDEPATASAGTNTQPREEPQRTKTERSREAHARDPADRPRDADVRVPRPRRRARPCCSRARSTRRNLQGKRLRLNLGKTDVTLRSTASPCRSSPAPDPVGYDFTPNGTRRVPLGQRPCA